MECVFKFEPFSIKVGLREFSISRDNTTITLHPVNVEHAINVLIDAMRIESFSILPKQLIREPYTVFFKEDRSLSLQENYQQTNIPLSFEEGDILINAIKAGLAKWLDISKHDTSQANFVPPNSGEGIPFDTGR